MNKRVQSIAACCLVLALGSCSFAPVHSDADVRRFLDRFIQSVNQANTQEFIECFASNATAFLPNTPTRRRGIEEIRAAVEPAFAQGPRTTRVELRDLMIEHHGNEVVATFDAGSGNVHARRTLVLNQIGGDWKITHLHASNVTEAS